MEYNKEYAKKVYAGLSKRGYTEGDLGSEDLFVARMGKENNRRLLYDMIARRGDANVGSWERFNERMSVPDIDKSQYTFTERELGLGGYQLGQPIPIIEKMRRKETEAGPGTPMGDDIYRTKEGQYTRTEVPFRTIEYPSLGMAQIAARGQQREDALAAYRSAYNRLEAPGEVDERTLIEWGNNMDNAPIEQRNLYKRITGRDATNRVDLDAVVRSYEESKRDFEGMENSGDIAAYLNMPAEQRVKLPEAERRQYEEILEAKRRDETVEGVNELHDRISSLMEKQRISDVKMHRGYRENRSTGQAIKDAILAASVADTPQLQGIAPSSGLEATPEGKRSNEQNAALTAAGRKWNEMKYIINAAKDGNIFDGLDKALGSVDTWTSDQMLRDNMAIMRVANKFDREGEGALTDNEKALLDALALNVAVSEMYGGEISAWYKGGEMIGEMTPFMIEMMINPLSGLGKKAADKVTRRAIEKYGKKLVRDNAKKFALARGAAKLGAGVAGATGMALTTGLPAVGAGTQQRMLGNATYDYDNERNVVYTGHKGGEESLFTAAREEVTSRMLDNVSEMLGAGYAGMPFKWLQKAGKGTKLLGWIDNLANSKFGKGVSRFAEKTKWNGPIEEFLEEVHVGLLNPVLVGDQSWEEFFTKDNLATIAIGVAIPGAAISALNTIGGAADGAFKVGAQERWKMQTAAARGAQLWKDNLSEWRALEIELSHDSMEDIEKELKKVYNNPDLTPEQKKVALEYAVYSLQWRTAQGVKEAFNEGKKFIDPMLRDIYGTAYEQRIAPMEANKAYRTMTEAEKNAQDILGIGEKSVDEWLNGRTAEEAARSSKEKLAAIKAYQAAKLDFEGRRDRFIAERDIAYMESDRSIQAHDNNGMVYATQYEGQPVYITGGDVVLLESGKIDFDRSSESLYVKFPDGHVEMIAPENFSEVFTEDRTEDLKAAKRAEIDERWKAEFDTAEVLARQQEVEQEKRDSGVVFDMTDPEGTHRVEILNEGNGMADILLDGKEEQIPTEELNRWKQEAGIQSADAVADNTTDNGTPTESEANVALTGDNVAPVAPVELPDVPDFFRLGGKNYSVASRNDDGSVDVMVDGKRETLPAGTDYSTHMPTDKKGEVQYEQMPVERTHEYFVQKVKDDEARAEMIEKRRKKAEAERKKFDKKPDPGIDPDAYEAKMTQWEADKKAAQAKVDYWKEVAKRDAEITRSETREAVNNIKPDVVEETADEFIANQLAGIKITPESFKRETGLSNAEQAQLVGVISNDGVSVERAAEIITENYDSELKALGFTGDVQDVRDAIISILSQGNPRGYAKRGREAREAENMDQQRADAEAWAKGAFDMKLEELYLYEETILPRIMRDYEGFEENEYYSNLAENNGYDTTRESESTGRGSELLQGEQPVPSGGTPVVGQRNEGGAVSDDVQGGGQNGVAQEEVPVNEPVGNSEQLSSSEIPNNPTISQTSDQVGDQAAEGDAPGQSGVYSLSELTDNEGNRFYQKNGSIDLWDLSPLFVLARRQNAPIRLTERNIDHILDEHKKELGDSEESVLKFLDDVFSTAKVLRKARSGGIFVVVENTKTDKAAIIRLYPSKYGDYYNVESAGYYRKNKWKDTENVIAELSEPTQSVTASDVSKPQVPEEGGKELLNAETATTSASEDRNSVSNSQENTQKSGENAENGGENAKTPMQKLADQVLARAEDKQKAKKGAEKIDDVGEKEGAGAAETAAEGGTQEGDVAFRQGDGPLTDREVVMESDVYSKVLGKPRYYGQKQRNYVARQRAKMAQKATELAEKLNTPIAVRETAEGLTGKKAKAKGWYDVKSGNIVVVVSNHGSIEDIQATVLHEVVAHKGLRQMFGEHFDTFLDNVYNNVDAEIRAEIDALTEKYGNTREATEEYLASLAENTYFEKVNPSLWSRIKQWFLNMLTEAGIKLDFELSDNELRYILWRSHQRLVNPGIYNTVTRITDVAVRARLGIGEYAPAVEEMSHVAEEDAAEYANKNQDIFVSNAQRAVEGIQQNKATAEQWIAMLKKNGGLKAGEDAWLGLEEWLNEKQGAVTKQEILDYIAQNRIKIEEVKYSQFGYGLMDEATRKLEAELKEIGWDAMVEKYPGFDELFEVYNGELLWSEERASVGEYEDFIIDNKIVDLDSQSNAINKTREKYTTEGLERKREIALTVPTIEPYNASDEVHFGDAGEGRAVAWVRFGETTDSEGNRVLVIDEIQSKRHQDGREKGYRGVGLAKDVLAAEEEVRKTNRELTAYREPLKEKYNFKGLGGSMSERLKNFDAMLSEEERITMDALGQARNEAEKRLQELREQERGIPSAPFEKNWHELAMKRMLRLAAEEGFDKVAWTTGEQQAQRYNIGAVLKGLKAYKTSANGYYVTPYNNGAIGEFVKEYTEQELADTFGKELAQKIIANAENATEENPYEIEGEEFRVGGEGMKGFYDRMLPSFVQKYTKKWGAKVGEVTMPELGENNTMWSVDVTPEMQESVMQGQTMFRIADDVITTVDDFNSTHKGAAPTVIIDSADTLEEQLRAEGFSKEDIAESLKDYDSEFAYYHPTYDKVVINDYDVPKDELIGYLWHENAHRAVRELYTREEMERLCDYIYKDEMPRVREVLSEMGYKPEELAEEAYVRGIEDVFSKKDSRRRLERGGLKPKEDATEEEKVIIDSVNRIVDFINNGREEERADGRRAGGGYAERSTQENRRGQDEEVRNSQETGENTQAGETRFRTVEETTDGSIDDVPAQPLTLMERITNSLLEVSAKNKENLGLRADALRTFGRDVTRVLSAMKAQKEYDKSTVDTLVKLAKMYFKNAQLLGEVDTYTMGRVLSLINNVVGKRDVTASAAKLMDILLDAHTKALAGILDKAEKVKAKKVNAAGVEVMGRLDKYGQKRVEEYRAAKEMTPEKLEEAIYDSDNRLAELEQRVREELGLPEGDVDQAARNYTGDNDAVNVYMDERARLEGLTLAREYKESIQQVQEEIKDLKRELKQAEEDYRLGNIDGKSLKEFRKSVAEAIMESKAGLIEGYHSLIYKFQENTKESSKRAKAFAQAQIDRAREIQHNANSDMEGISAATQGTHPDNYNNAVMNALRSPFSTFQGMLKKFGEKNVEGKGYLYERFIPQATQASDNEFRGKVAARVMIESKLKEIYGEEANIARFIKELREYGATVTYREGNEMKQFDLTKGQMLYIYMVNKMPDGQMKLRRMGITDDVVAELMTKLPEEAVQFADWAQNELLKDLRGKYNAVHERVFGAPMAAIENYFPIKIRKEARGEKGDVSEVGQEGKPSTVTGSIIKRTKNATAIDLSADAMQVLMEHIDDMEHWAAFAEFNRDLNVLLNYKHFQNQVKNMTSVRYGSGTELWKNFQKTAQIVSGTYRPSDSSIDRAVQNIAKGLTRSKINFRLYTAIKQLLSAPAFWTDAGVEELAYCYVNPKGSFEWAKENLPGFAERWQGRAMGNEKLLKSDSDWELWRNEFVEKATRWGMTPNAAIDALTVAQGARAVYMTKLEQFKKAGYTEQRANEKALQAAAEAYNESQQSSEGIYLSPLQVEGTVASAIFSTFKNSNFGYTRKTAQAIANIKRKMRKGYKEETIAFMTKQMVRDGLSEENAKKMAERVYNKSKYRDVANVAMFGFGLNLLWEAGGYAIYLLLGDDDEEKEKMMKEIALRGSLGLLNGIPFGETMISAAMAVKEGDTKYFRLPELVAVSDIKNLAQVLNYDPVRGANDIVNMLTSMGVGVTPQVLTDILVAFGDVEEFSAEELGMFAARLVNAPQSNLERLMVDDAMENSAINAEEIMRRYAEYKKSKNAPITQFFYPEEEEKKVIERYEKRFEKLLDERLENVIEDNDAYDLFYKGADARRKSELAKMRQKYLAEDKAKALEKLDSKELVDMVLNSTKEANKDINEEYFNLSTAEDEDTAFIIKSVKKALDDLKEGGKLSDKERRLLSRLNELNYAINNAKRLMERQPERAQEHMNNIREMRAKAMELINNYRKDE